MTAARRVVGEALGTGLLVAAVIVARSLTDTFTGIRPADVPGFLAGQAAVAAVATVLIGWLVPPRPSGTARG